MNAGDSRKRTTPRRPPSTRTTASPSSERRRPPPASACASAFSFFRAGGGEAQRAGLAGKLCGAAGIAGDARAPFVGDAEGVAALGGSRLAGPVEGGSGFCLGFFDAPAVCGDGRGG